MESGKSALPSLVRRINQFKCKWSVERKKRLGLDRTIVDLKNKLQVLLLLLLEWAREGVGELVREGVGG